MVNTLDDYIWRSLPEWGEFATNPNLEKKVDTHGYFLPYYENPTVFLLEESVKEHLHHLQNGLYEAVGWMLAEPLQPSTFHMTLHDLINGPVEDILLQESMEKAEHQARKILQQFSKQPPIKMQTTWLFNMVNTSIVLGLLPADSDSWHRLDWVYTALESDQQALSHHETDGSSNRRFRWLSGNHKRWRRQSAPYALWSGQRYIDLHRGARKQGRVYISDRYGCR